METTNYEIDVIDENEVEIIDRGYDEAYEESTDGGMKKGIIIGTLIAAAGAGAVMLGRKLAKKKDNEKMIKKLEAEGYKVCKIDTDKTEVDEVVEEPETTEE